MRRFFLAGSLLLLSLGLTIQLLFSLNLAAASQPPTTAQSINTVQVTGHLGGPAQAIDMANNTLFAGIGPEFASFSLANPDEPERLDYRLYSENLNAVVISDNLAFITDGNLHLLDINNPANLQPLGSVSVPGTLLNVNVNGTQLVAVGGNFGAPFGQLRVFDIMTPTAPTELSMMTFPVEARGVAMTGTTALVANDSNGLVVLNLTDPQNPQIIRTKATMGQAYDVLIGDGAAYVATVDCAVNCTGGIQVFDLANPNNPSSAAFVPLPSQPNRLAMADTYLFVANGAGGMALLDIQDPLNPVNLGLTDLPEDAMDVVASGDDAYVATGRGGIQHLSISPTLHTGGIPSFANAYSVAFANEYAFVGDGEGLYVVDATTASDPVIVDFTATSADVYRLTLTDDHLFLSLQLDGLSIYDVSNPTSPQFVATFNTPGSVNGIVVAGSYAYLADGATGLRILDISNMAAPTEVANVDTAGVAWDLFKDGDRLYVADFDRGVRIFDVSDPTDPQEIGLYNTPGEAFAVNVFADLAYIADGFEGVRIVDVSDPQSPFEIGSFDNFRHAYDLELVGEYLYVANDTGGLLTLSVTDPTTPTELRRNNTAGQAWGVTVDRTRHLIAIADRFGGFYLFKQSAIALRGSVLQANGLGYAGVTISSDLGSMAVTDGSGHFDFANPILGPQTVSADLAGFVFAPPTNTVNLPPAQTMIRFTILPEPVQATVSAAGGSLSYTATDGVTTTLTIPAGAVNTPISLILTPTLVTPPTGLAFAAHAFELAAYDGDTLLPAFSFNQPVVITIDYSDADLTPINDESTLDLYFNENSGWISSGASCSPSVPGQIDVGQNRLETALCSTGLFGLFGQPLQLYLPIIQQP